jgi:tRNA (guanine-N7-)-methyltransferase
MGRNKLPKFDFNFNAPNVVQSDKSNFETIAGNWNKELFKHHAPITLEIGCGHGDYSIGIAQQFADRNTIGVDVKGSRLFRGAKFALENKLDNVAFLRTRIHEIEKNFAANEVDEFWITFPDPRPRD